MSASTEISRQAFGLSDSGTVRLAAAGDAVDGVMPRVVIEADAADDVAKVLAWSSRERLTVVLRGGATKIGWGRRPNPIDVVLSTRRLNRVLAHRHGDLTATVEAGASLGDFNRELARHRQWLPLDTAFGSATVGGIIATNDSGPLRHRHGTPRDLLIGIGLATTDGRLVKAGGHVVKNVAGYDLGKLVSGSFGSLAAIVSATFKLAPIPMSSQTMVARFRDPEAAGGAIAAIGASQLEPAAFDLHMLSGGLSGGASTDRSAPFSLFLRFTSTPATIAEQIDQARRVMAEPQHIDLVANEAESELWREQMSRVWDLPGAVARVSWPPGKILRVVSLLQDIGRSGRHTIELAGRASVGAGFVRIDADVAIQAAAIDRLRAQPDVIGNVVLLRGEPALKEMVDVWGDPGDTTELRRAVKRAFDPMGILNAQRGPV
jgi:glycolate oxidase FAD binding subunit